MFLVQFHPREDSDTISAPDKSANATDTSVTNLVEADTIIIARQVGRVKEGRTMLYLGWIVAAFLAGCIITALIFTRRKTLRERLIAMGSLIGKDYAQIVAEVQTTPKSTVREANGQTLRSWEEGNYFVSLLFDKDDVCLGVMDERG